MSSVLSQEFIATERRQVVLEAMEGLEALRRKTRLTFTQVAALEALKRLYARSRFRNAVITHAEMVRPVAIAHGAMEAERCVH